MKKLEEGQKENMQKLADTLNEISGNEEPGHSWQVDEKGITLNNISAGEVQNTNKLLSKIVVTRIGPRHTIRKEVDNGLISKITVAGQKHNRSISCSIRCNKAEADIAKAIELASKVNEG